MLTQKFSCVDSTVRWWKPYLFIYLFIEIHTNMFSIVFKNHFNETNYEKSTVNSQ
jgi:hypothetical protein